jgi:hypothetical protein
MIKEAGHKEELLVSVENVFSQFIALLEKSERNQINAIPFPGSWTAAQVADHVTKSNQSITKALLLHGTIINRNPFARVQELKNVFLNFDTKLQSPDFILPDKEIYEKETLIRKLVDSIHKIIEAAGRIELLEMINHQAFGDITKFEILHFVVYHTQRHTHQLEKIAEALNKKFIQ